MHTLIVGDPGVGKSTLIQKILKETARPVFGFETKKEMTLWAEGKDAPVYIYEAGKPHIQSEENFITYSKAFSPEEASKAFNRFADKLSAARPEDAIILMDEIGYMESQADKFAQAIMSFLDGNQPVIAAVKTKKIPFLDQIRNHPNCRCFYITPENRNVLFNEVLEFVKIQLENS